MPNKCAPKSEKLIKKKGKRYIGSYYFSFKNTY